MQDNKTNSAIADGYTGTAETIEGTGEVPDARFGHTVTTVSKAKVVLFGGATGDTGRYGMQGDTHMLNVETMTWKKLKGKESLEML